MNHEPKEDIEILIAVYNGQRQESLQHRQSIYNSFSLGIAGLLVILGGLLAANVIPTEIRWLAGVGIFAFCFYIIYFIRQQRNESDKGLGIMLKVEKRLGLYETNRYVQNESVLPESYENPGRKPGEFSEADYFHSLILLFLGLVNILIIIFKG